MAPYTIAGLLLGLVGASWFAWHFARPLPTTVYWPGWWYRNRWLSIFRLRLYAIGGMLASLGVIGVALYPALLEFAVGLGLIVLGSLLQAVIALGSRRGNLEDHAEARARVGLRPTVEWPGLGRKLAILLAGYLIVLATMTWVVAALYPDYPPPPAGGYAQTTGTVLATYPANHDQVRYSYSVGGRSFEAVWFADGPEGHASQLRVGQTISIWYEVGDPSRSCSCSDPHELAHSNNDRSLPAAFLALVVTGAFVLGGARWVLGSWQSVGELIEAITSRSRDEPTGEASSPTSR